MNYPVPPGIKLLPFEQVETINSALISALDMARNIYAEALEKYNGGYKPHRVEAAKEDVRLIEEAIAMLAAVPQFNFPGEKEWWKDELKEIRRIGIGGTITGDMARAANIALTVVGGMIYDGDAWVKPPILPNREIIHD